MEEASPGLDIEHIRFLEQMYDRGDLLEGVSCFGNNLVKGVGNGLFSGILRVRNDPTDTDQGGGRRGNQVSMGKDSPRMVYTGEAIEACMSAGFPLLFEGDGPVGSVMGAAAAEALKHNYTGLGQIGRDSALLVQRISREFVDAWNSGTATEGSLSNSWTILNLEVRYCGLMFVSVSFIWSFFVQ